MDEREKGFGPKGANTSCLGVHYATVSRVLNCAGKEEYKEKHTNVRANTKLQKMGGSFFPPIFYL